MGITKEMWEILIGHLSSTTTKTEGIFKIVIEMDKKMEQIIKLLKDIKTGQTGIQNAIIMKG